MVTKIIKGDPMSRRSTYKSKRSKGTNDSMLASDRDQTDRARREGDANRVLKKLKKVEEDELNRRKEVEDGESLDQIFKSLVS